MPLDPTTKNRIAPAPSPELTPRLLIAAVLFATAPTTPPDYQEFTGEVSASTALGIGSAHRTERSFLE